jgi:uncharacterized protein
MHDEIIDAAIGYVRELFRNNANGHDADHSLRVYRNAMRIADREPGCDRSVVALTALLHDADDHKLFRTENNANARAFLIGQSVDAETIDRICGNINAVSFSRNRGTRPETIEGAIVQDADRLDAIGAIGIARTFAYGGAHGRPLDDSVAHFHQKLLLLKNEMNTQTARRIAESRHAFLETFLEAYDKETRSD